MTQFFNYQKTNLHIYANKISSVSNENSDNDSENDSDNDSDEISVTIFNFKGKKYFKSEDNILYNEESDIVGRWNSVKNDIVAV